MPIYEYHCLECGEAFEKLVLFSEISSTPECPTCHSTHTQKRISLFATGGASTRSSSSSSSSQTSCAPSTSGFR